MMETWTDFFGNEFSIGDTIYYWPSSERCWQKSTVKDVVTEVIRGINGAGVILVNDDAPGLASERASFYASISNRKLLDTAFRKGDQVFFKNQYRQIIHGTVDSMEGSLIVIRETHDVMNGKLQKLEGEEFGKCVKVRPEFAIKIRDGISTAINTLRKIEE